MACAWRGRGVEASSLTPCLQRAAAAAASCKLASQPGAMRRALKLWVPKLWRQADAKRNAQRYLRAGAYLLNLHTLLVCAASCLAVYVCEHWSFRCGAGVGEQE